MLSERVREGETMGRGVDGSDEADVEEREGGGEWDEAGPGPLSLHTPGRQGTQQRA
jgi:hypothetical protein